MAVGVIALSYSLKMTDFKPTSENVDFLPLDVL